MSIIVEERLKELFATLPKITVGQSSYPVNFDFGSHKDLLRFMNSQRKFQGGVSYPLIWLETPFERDVMRDGHINLSGLTLILATLSDSEQSNTTRLELAFKTTLIPLSKLVLESLRKGGFTQIINDGQRTETNYYNYGVDETESQTTDIWDVIKIELDIIMDNQCLRCINY